ncbi:fungal-specific transcription factor domain-containing protein [Amylocystis lapponica]|nr:fungal-specific transcription factor domain-containing protein [Amylocystis lapponica]
MDANPNLNPPSKPAAPSTAHPANPTTSRRPADKHSNKPSKSRRKADAQDLSRNDSSDNRSTTSRVSSVRDQQQQQPPASSSRFTAHLQPYPGPTGPAYVMNPSYPMNGGNPYPSSPSPFHQPQNPASPTNGSPHVGPGIPGHPPQYSYAAHHTPYHQGYPSYPQYPVSGMMMYSTPPASHPDHIRSTTASSPVPQSASSMGKRKRKSAVDDDYDRASNEDHADSGSDLARSAAQGSSSSIVVDTKKRTKTQRACDSCRSRKIRCDVLQEADPPVCQHCKQYGFECTFFLPITETRFKKKKLEEEAAAAAVDKEKETERSTSSPQAEHSKSGEVQVFGPTSAAYMLHSQATINSRTYESYDMRYHHAWDVSSSGDGIISVHEPQQGELQLAMPKPVDMRLERDVIEQLVNAYFAEVAPMLPVVTQAEFLDSSPPPPVLLYSMCLVAAARREVPQGVFDSIRYAVNSLIKAEDVLSTASIVNVQALLILAMVGDSHSQFVPNALSAMWIRLGAAIRMAQDLGLHRAESVKQNIELRRRLWGICVISDRWISITYGHPYMIDVQDCDARLPSSGDRNDLYMDELVRLSVLLGRVQKTIYTPAGLTVTNDEALHALLADLEAWRRNLPEELQFHGPETPQSAGMLFMMYACVNMIFWRVFMRISYTCPSHLKFALTVENWTALVNLTGEAIDWLDAHERMYDVWLLVAYCATSCALVQYHTWARRRDSDAQARLKKLRDCVRKWEASLSPDHMSARRKTAEIIALLYEATQGPPLPLETPVLNPTTGVTGKKPPPQGGLVFQKDPSRPGGGVFVVSQEGAVDRDVPEGTIIRGDDNIQGEMRAAAVSDVGIRNNSAPLSFPSHSAPMSWATSSLVGHAHQPQQQAQQQQRSAEGSSSMSNYSNVGSSMSNMNPALNDTTGNVQVMNVLDVPQASNTLEQFAMADTGFLEGIPGSMFDWGQWDNFFSRFAPQVAYSQQHRAGDVGEMSTMAPSAPQSAPHGGPQYYQSGPDGRGL